MEEIFTVPFAFILLNEGFLYIKRADKSKTEPGKWSLAGGKVESGETLKRALIREIFEETGIKAEEIELNDVGDCVITVNRLGERLKLKVCLFFLNKSNLGLSSVAISHEHSEKKLITFPELAEARGSRESLSKLEISAGDVDVLLDDGIWERLKKIAWNAA